MSRDEREWESMRKENREMVDMTFSGVVGPPISLDDVLVPKTALEDAKAEVGRLREAVREIEALHWFRNPYTSGYQSAFEQAKGIAGSALSEPLDREEG